MIRIRLTTEPGLKQGTFSRAYVVEHRQGGSGLWQELGRATTKAAAEAIKARHERPAPTHCEQCGKPLAGAAWGRRSDGKARERGAENGEGETDGNRKDRG